MYMDHVPVNWFDMVVVITLLVGLNKGRKHGMSEELVITVQWIAIVLAGAFLYKPLGDMLAMSSPVSHVFCYVAIYISVAIATKIAFGIVKKVAGGKLVGSGVFGSAEYYLGMLAGGVRFTCILLAGLALLKAPYYTSQDIAAARAVQNQNFGSNFFPEVSSIQIEVFKESFTGGLLKRNAPELLIASTKSENVQVRRAKDDLP